MSPKSKRSPTAAADGGGGGDEAIGEILTEMQDNFSIGERLRLAAAIADQVAKDKVAERARIGRKRALQIVEAVARDLKRGEC